MYDFNITSQGELIYNHLIQDIDKVKDDDLTRQIAINRIKSVVGDWFNTKIGANLEEYIGMPNTPSTSFNIMESIVDALTFDEFLEKSSIYQIPRLDRTNLSIKLFIKKEFENEPIVIDVVIDMSSGVRVSYGTDK